MIIYSRKELKAQVAALETDYGNLKNSTRIMLARYKAALSRDAIASRRVVVFGDDRDWNFCAASDYGYTPKLRQRRQKQLERPRS